MRSRFLPKLINQEVEDYLEHHDIVFVPVGVVEMHGGLSLDCETVLAEAFALKMAEAADGLVLNNLPYFFAGATVIGRGTVQVSVREGIDYLHALAMSLHRQGFRRQIYVSFHGPAEYTVTPMVRDFFDETHAQILYLDLVKLALKVNGEMFLADSDALNNLFFGAYAILGRLEDIPLTTGPAYDFHDPGPSSVFSDAMKPYLPGVAGYYFERKEDHAPTPAVKSREEREQRAEQGRKLIESTIEKMDMPGIVQKMKSWGEFQQKEVFPKYEGWLPKSYK